MNKKIATTRAAKNTKYADDYTDTLKFGNDYGGIIQRRIIRYLLGYTVTGWMIQKSWNGWRVPERMRSERYARHTVTHSMPSTNCGWLMVIVAYGASR